MINRKLSWGLCRGVLGYLLLGALGEAVAQDPPFGGTVWVDPDIIQPGDWTAHQSLSYSGIAPRFVYDRRDNVYLTRLMHIFHAVYADAPEVEVHVNSIDFSTSVAAEYASSYAEMVGRLPTPLHGFENDDHSRRRALPFGGAENGILIHVDVEPFTVAFLEEILVHEAAHANYGTAHDVAPAWQAAQAADPTFISLYARDNPNREDVAETLLMWYAVRYRNDRLDAATIAATEAAIPNRLAYFDVLPFEIAESVPGDINFDQHVDAADYVLWRDNPYRTPWQYDQWRAHFGQTAGSGSVAASTSQAAVPEPTSLVLLTSAGLAMFVRRRNLVF